MKCPKCGADNVEGLQFCKRCWTPSRPDQPKSGADVDGEARPGSTRGPLFGVPYVGRDTADGTELPWAQFRDRELPRRQRGSEPDLADPDAGPSPRSVLSLILGILSVVLFCALWNTIPLDLAGFVVGVLELRDIDHGSAPASGRGFATAGIILSGCAIVVKLFILLMVPHG